MKLQLKHIAPYLEHNLRLEITQGGSQATADKYCMLTGVYVIKKQLCIWSGAFGYGEKKFVVKPLLRPLSDLYKEINNNGKTFIPADELSCYKMYGRFHHGKEVVKQMLKENIIGYGDIQKLLALHFDVFGLIKRGLAKDINSIKI